MSTYSELRERMDIEAAKFEVRAAAWNRWAAAMAVMIQTFWRELRGVAQPNGYRRARRKYGYRSFPSRRAR